MRFMLMASIFGLMALVASDSRTAEVTPKEKAAVMTALQSFNDYIGAWNGDGESKMGKNEFWKEGMNWGWKFNKDGSTSLQVEFKDSKAFGKGVLVYLPDTKKYKLTILGADKKELLFEGEIKRKVLSLSRVDPTSMDKYTINMSTTNEGALFNMEYTVQTGGKGIDKKIFVVSAKKEGASISGGKKNECIVSGGVGTMAVSFEGKWYYVCCGGCRDAFTESPKKFVDEYLKTKGK
ncbi:MAG: hypothetical protein K8T89_24040 [Planctomycetes bacterium]|nr:hypothetical protein [Planctomycetota bacterium]